MLFQAIKDYDLDKFEYYSKRLDISKVRHFGHTPLTYLCEKYYTNIVDWDTSKYVSNVKLWDDQSYKILERIVSTGIDLDFKTETFPYKRAIDLILESKNREQKEKILKLLIGKGASTKGLLDTKYLHDFKIRNLGEKCIDLLVKEGINCYNPHIYSFYERAIKYDSHFLIDSNLHSKFIKLSGFIPTDGSGILYSLVVDRINGRGIDTMKKIEFVLENGGENDQLPSVYNTRSFRSNPYYLAYENYDFELIKAMLKSGTNPNFIEAIEHSPLSILSLKKRGSKEKVEYTLITKIIVELLNHNANPYLKGCMMMEDPIILINLINSNDLKDNMKLLAFSYYLDRATLDDLKVSQEILNHLLKFKLTENERNYFIQQLKKRGFKTLADKLAIKSIL